MRALDDVDRRLLVARNLTVTYGIDLLDTNDETIDTLVDQVVDGTITRVNGRNVDSTLELNLLTTLPPLTRVRPWQTLQANGEARTYPLGVYVLTTIPDQDLTQTPPVVAHEGYDKLHLLQHPVGDTYVVTAGTGYLDAARTAITDAGYTGLPPLLAGDAETKTLDQDYVWILNPATTWAHIVNDLLAAIGYRALWADNNGRLRSEPYQSPAERAVEWTFDTDDPTVTIVSPARTFTFDEYRPTNYWRFIRDGLTTTPTEGAGYHTIDETAGGTRYPRIETVTAADQEALEALTLQARDADTRTAITATIAVGPFPVLGHYDVTTYIDPAGGALKVVTREHTIPLDATTGDVQLILEVLA